MSTSPQLRVPPDACDCHMHAYEDRFPILPTAPFKPPHAPASAYRAMQKRLGLQRVVVVQPTAYGFDNACTLQAMSQLSPGARGIAVVPPELSDAQLNALTQAGIRGVRYMMIVGGVLGWDTVEAMAERV